MIGNRLLTAMLLCGAFMEDERPQRPPPPPKPPPPEPDDRDPAAPAVDPVRYLELWIAEHGGASEAVLRKVLDDAYGITTRGVEIGEHLPTRITGVLRESHDVPDALTVLPEPPAVWHQGNSLGKTSVDMRNLLDGITSERQIKSTADGMRAFGVETSRASEAVWRFSERIADDIPARAAEPYKPAFPPRKVTYVPFYTPEEQAERAAQAKAKKAKHKHAQAAKRRNRS